VCARSANAAPEDLPRLDALRVGLAEISGFKPRLDALRVGLAEISGFKPRRAVAPGSWSECGGFRSRRSARRDQKSGVLA